MPSKSPSDLSLFFDVLQKLELIEASYVIIGGFAATVYGISRATFDIDIIVDLDEGHIQALSELYPLPRYYADPFQMRNAMAIGSKFNIIDTARGEKADLFAITIDERYRPALDNRVRQLIEPPNIEPFSVWVARLEDVIIGKLMALAELSVQRHERDIREMLVSYYLGFDLPSERTFDKAYVDGVAQRLGNEVFALWQTLHEAARQEAEENS